MTMAALTTRFLLAASALQVLSSGGVNSFSPQATPHCRDRYSGQVTRAFGISEWRDLPVEADLTPPGGHRNGDPIVRRLPVLLTSSGNVALQGQKMYYQWTRDDDVRLFQRAVDNNGGVFGLGLVRGRCSEEEKLLDKVVLMQIEDYNIMGQDFGIFCSSKVVGRASVLQAEVNAHDDEPLTVLCNEVFDRREIISLEEASVLAKAVKELVTEVSIAEQPTKGVEDFANLEDLKTTRLDRFWEAYEAAIAADNQGYFVSSSDSDENSLSWDEISAISWAAFGTNDSLKNDEVYRLSAFDMDSITNRLKFAVYWLSDVLIETLA
jgi:hypothetical protein